MDTFLLGGGAVLLVLLLPLRFPRRLGVGSNILTLPDFLLLGCGRFGWTYGDVAAAGRRIGYGNLRPGVTTGILCGVITTLKTSGFFIWRRSRRRVGGAGPNGQFLS